jgi:hypothetical protein
MYVALWSFVFLCVLEVVEIIAHIDEEKKVDSDALASTEPFYQHMSDKSHYLAWIIIVKILSCVCGT